MKENTNIRHFKMMLIQLVKHLYYARIVSKMKLNTIKYIQIKDEDTGTGTKCRYTTKSIDRKV